jgi:hypothetical protein|tara:strand:- start:1085 stop:1837 length:753 start_codon:yes stop_codon:yes gene_type:complete
MAFGNLFKNVSDFARQAAPLVAAGAAFSTGGQSATLARVAGGLGALGGTEQGQRTAIDRPQQPAAETASSGEAGRSNINVINTVPTSGGIVPASYGMNVPQIARSPRAQQAGLPAIVGGGAAVGRGVMNMLGLAGGAIMVAPIIIDPLTGEEKKLRVTRRLKSQVKKAVELFGVEFVAEQMGVDVEVVVYIMTKRMRNDGPYVTKAAVRKTRQTVRKMKNLCDMYEDLRPTARRRAPARKTMSTRITNVK